MAQFTLDNTAGFTPAQLAALNEAFGHNLARVLADLGDGANSDGDLIEQIKKTLADELLNNWVG